MATTRIIPMHINKGKTIAQCLKARVDYVKNPDKTEGGALISAYACSPETADQEFLLARSEYMAITGRKIHNEVIAYQLRQSFKPGEVTPEEANKIGYELASQFLKGEHAFIVATHNDRRHVHLHVVYVPIVEKQILWTKRCKDPALVGTVKETIMQVSHSKKWASRPVLDASGNPMRTKGGKIVLRKSYSVLQDQFHDHMFAAGFTDVQRGERGSAEEHLTTVQFKVMKEEETLTTLWAEQQRAQQAAAHAEAQRQEAEHEAETAQKKLDRLTQSAGDVAAFMQKNGSADALLPEPGVLESARSYRAGKALPLVSKLLRKLKDVYALWIKERQANAGLMQETAYWKRQAQTNEAAREKAARLDKLTRILGVDEIDRLLTPHRNSTRAPRKAREQDHSIY